MIRLLATKDVEYCWRPKGRKMNGEVIKANRVSVVNAIDAVSCWLPSAIKVKKINTVWILGAPSSKKANAVLNSIPDFSIIFSSEVRISVSFSIKAPSQA